MRVTTIDKEVKDIFSGNFYVIPRFQRPYSWERENIDEFWTDTIQESTGDYFIGSIVVFKDAKKDTYGIVDGQQRLTTITMILCALRNAFNAAGLNSLGEGVHNFIERADINNKLRYVLHPETSYPYFQEYVQKRTKPETEPKSGAEEQLLQKAFGVITKTINDIVSERLESAKPLKRKKAAEKVLTEIRDKIFKLKLIFIELDNEEDAYLIFETLNTRGKDLKVSDLVKNHITKIFKPKNAGVDLPKERWNRLAEVIDESDAGLDVDSFIHYYWLSKYDFVTLKKLFKQVRKKIGKQNAGDFLLTLEKDAITYREINEDSYRTWGKQEASVRDALNALGLFRVKQAMPMLLSVMREYKARAIRLPHAADILTSIENFHFVFTAVTSQRSSGGISFMYAKAARELHDAKTLDEKLKVVRGLKKKLHDKLPDKEEFKANFNNILFSKELTKQKKLVQYILKKITEKQFGLPIDHEKMTLEHIAPESPEANGDKVPKKFIGALGNLMLVNEELNGKLKNLSFARKKEMLQRHNMPLDQIVSGAEQWDVKKIKDRNALLADLAYDKIWTI